jgi:hypothetical protein
LSGAQPKRGRGRPGHTPVGRSQFGGVATVDMAIVQLASLKRSPLVIFLFNINFSHFLFVQTICCRISFDESTKKKDERN